MGIINYIINSYTAIIVSLIPVLTFVIALTGFFDLNWKDSFEYFDKVDVWIKKRKVDVLSRVISSSGPSNGIGISNDLLTTLASDIDDIISLQNLLIDCKKKLEYFYLFLLIIFLLGITLLFLYSIPQSAKFISQYSAGILIIVLILTIGGLLFMFKKKLKLREEYNKQYEV